MPSSALPPPALPAARRSAWPAPRLRCAASRAVGFLLILLILAAIGNLPNLAFKLPDREKLNDIGGAALGAVNGVCFGILLCWALQFAGPVIGRDTLAHTALAKALQAIDVLTLGVGV